MASLFVLGGSTPEYNACPASTILNHFFDGAIDPIGHTSSVSTNLVLVPCSEDLVSRTPGSATVQYTVYNEFEERRSVTKPFTGQQVGALEDIDSIFTVGTEGTLTGQTQLISTGSGILAVAVEAHQDPGDPTHVATAAINAHVPGGRPEVDTRVVPLAPCTSWTDCRSYVCVAGVCQAPTCSDGVQNGGESDVDCGGPDCPACADGQRCSSGADCVSGQCESFGDPPGYCVNCGDGVKDF